MRYVCYAIAIGLFMTGSGLQAADQVDQLIKSLESVDKADRLLAIDILANLGAKAKPAVPALQQALAAEDAEVRWHAARTLGAIGADAKSAEAALAKALKDADPQVRGYAAFALGKMDADANEIVTALLESVLDEDVFVRRAAIHALRAIDPPTEVTAPMVGKLFEKADPALISMAIKTVAEDGAEAVPRLIKALEHEDACYWAMLALQEIGPEAKAAVPGLRKHLGHKHEECRMQALMALGAIGEAAAAAKTDVIGILENEDDMFGGVKFAAAYALGKIGEKEDANEALTKSLESTDNDFLKIVCAWALARLNREDKQIGQQMADIIVTGLRSKDKHVRAAAARALAEFDGYEGTVGAALVSALQDSDPIVVGNALDALASMGAEIIPGLEKGLQNKAVRAVALRVVQRMGEESKLAVPALVAALANDDGDNAFRSQVQYTLGLIGAAAQPAIPGLLKSLDSDDENVRGSALFALAKMGPAAKPAGRKLVAILQDDQRDEHVRLTVGWALLAITNRDARIARIVAPMLRKALAHEDPSVRMEAATTLGNLVEHGRAAMAELEKLKDDPDAEVRQAASAALEKLK